MRALVVAIIIILSLVTVMFVTPLRLWVPTVLEGGPEVQGLPTWSFYQKPHRVHKEGN